MLTENNGLITFRFDAEVIKLAVENYLNEHLFKDPQRVCAVTYEYNMETCQHDFRVVCQSALSRLAGEIVH